MKNAGLHIERLLSIIGILFIELFFIESALRQVAEIMYRVKWEENDRRRRICHVAERCISENIDMIRRFSHKFAGNEKVLHEKIERKQDERE